MVKNIFTKTEKDIDDLMKKTISIHSESLNLSTIEPLSQEYDYCTYGLNVFIAQQSSGKSFLFCKHVLIMQSINYYDRIVICSTNDGLDKTVGSFINKFNCRVDIVPPHMAVNYFTELQNSLKLLYAVHDLIDNIKNKSFEIPPLIQTLIKTNNIQTKQQLIKFIITFLESSSIKKSPPYRTLAFFDDFEGEDLLASNKKPLSKFLTKRRHISIEAFVAVQTVKGICKAVKRLSTSFTIWTGLSFDDFESTLKEINGIGKSLLYELWQIYIEYCVFKRDRIEFHNVSQKIKLINVNPNNGNTNIILIKDGPEVKTYEQVKALLSSEVVQELKPKKFEDNKQTMNDYNSKMNFLVKSLEDINNNLIRSQLGIVDLKPLQK